jgi:hypothetical protein
MWQAPHSVLKVSSGVGGVAAGVGVGWAVVWAVAGAASLLPGDTA